MPDRSVATAPPLMEFRARASRCTRRTQPMAGTVGVDGVAATGARASVGEHGDLLTPITLGARVLQTNISSTLICSKPLRSCADRRRCDAHPAAGRPPSPPMTSATSRDATRSSTRPGPRRWSGSTAPTSRRVPTRSRRNTFGCNLVERGCCDIAGQDRPPVARGYRDHEPVRVDGDELGRPDVDRATT